MMKYKTRLTAVICIILSTLLLVGCGSAPASGAAGTQTARDVHITYGGNASTTPSYMIAVAYGEIVNTNVPGVTMTVEETGGGFEVLVQLIEGELDAASVSAGPVYNAQRHLDQFAEIENADNFYAWIPMYTSVYQAVVKADSDIYCYADMAGKNIGIDLAGTGSENTHRIMLREFGLEDSVTAFNVSKSESMEMLKTGELDVAMIGTAAPTSCIVEFGTSEEFRIIPFSDEEVELMLNSELAYLVKGYISKDTYEQMTEDVQTIVSYTSALISKELDEETVYLMTKAIWENRDRLETAHPSQELLNPQMVKDLGTIAPYHPGAERYYKEMGWLD